MTRTIPRTLLIALAASLALSACETINPVIGAKPDTASTRPAGTGDAKPVRPPPGSPGNPNTAASAQPAADQQALKEGIELYNKGQFNDAIKRLSASEVASGSKQVQVQAAKYMAFSYCVTARQTLCRQSFEKAFKLDPAFDLQPGEHGHPLWGPAFARAKKGK